MAKNFAIGIIGISIYAPLRLQTVWDSGEAVRGGTSVLQLYIFFLVLFTLLHNTEDIVHHFLLLLVNHHDRMGPTNLNMKEKSIVLVFAREGLNSREIARRIKRCEKLLAV